ncbi:LacI family transcriptional regulator [Ruania alba]|uniref:LacI family transcriptional regulator n=2 Tax=Ruania alba TaxID=648782 RepID=A0A1H5L3L2_9MICO|nr:LacI family DNA-binding transcriptional regulator [Ruania alba]SEE71177.1 LacI family transcriptional regulator [Ruania alba]
MTERPRGRVGIREVAHRAGVSDGTVSNVMNRPHLVAPATVARVLAVMDEIGFVRNSLAHQLRTGAGTTIGLVVLNAANPFFAELAHACEEAAERRGMTVLTGSSNQDLERENRFVDVFEQQRVRGVLVAPIDGPTPRMERLQERGSALVLFDTHPHPGRFATVSLDGHAAGAMAVRHLIECGSRRIAFVGGPMHLVHDRWAGATEELRRHPGVLLQHVDTAEQTVTEGQAAGSYLAALPKQERPDALFGANDLLALGLLQALAQHETLRVPQDIAVMGYDDIEFSASAIVPLTSIRQPRDKLASEGLRLLIEGSADPRNHREQVLLPPELIVRASTKR